MPVSEFDIIEQVFRSRAGTGHQVVHGIGDDAAVVEAPIGHQLVISTDTMVEQVHFFADADPFDVGYKSLAVNLSDIAAMGADPLWMTLSLTLPDNNLAWLQRYADGLFALAEEHKVGLIGGNIAHGSLSISITILGSVPAGTALLRSTARPDDDIYITGMPGIAALGLSMLQGDMLPTPACTDRLLRPQPRVQAGRAIRSYASACIDISDGLAADLGHLLDASNVGAQIELDRLPVFDVLRQLQPEELWDYMLCRGDDYELCFTAAQQHRKTVHELENVAGCKITRIGRVTPRRGIRWVNQDGSEIPLKVKGYRHF